MRIAPLLLLASSLVAPSAATATDELFEQEAQALAPGGGPLQYREEHLLRSRDGRMLERLVVYRCPSGAPFARKLIDYSKSAIAPAFTFEDARNGYREGLRRAPASTQLYVRRREGQGEEFANLPAPPAVADAGFDEFVRAHWDALARGDSLPLSFAVPALLRTLEFRVHRIGTPVIDGEPALLFRLRMDGILGWVVPHLDVAYSARTRRILRFEGIGNLRDPSGKKQWEVRIEFPHPARPAPGASWSTALSEALVHGCGSGQVADSPARRTLAGVAQVTDP